MAKEQGRKTIAKNRRARYEYHIEDTYEAGLVLTGTEVKSLREGRASLTDGFGLIFQGEAWLENVYIPEYLQGTWTNHSARRKRKMLLHKDEILKISHKLKESGRTLVPLELYFDGSRAKVEIAVARGKKDWDKRETLRRKQDEREAQRAMSLRRQA
ncbi:MULTISPECIES: SsrA-binding protein SmpB [Brevibacterium]|uniref:SsrA-binding protein n=1 Tax=Brevibacterium luteolum TaxID=199591 RepID=A0A2N6PEQ8_9MICO|nr:MULTISPECIES: SsrA-binding protein SmpB [Brevibacterium]MBM7529294.1 SsrA-binding protein [Brevibacterium luteolum]MCT1657870.1 SsrA-binding protein SmpB [Brevibacterium luteolum]MCT1829057.1 SsrA-binding protein SmpB [Brevibacterium luteolum]MCT1872524.1 SsrA-binding protein SmpB [Brevibacterium luteolum]MCT1890419.1 SsrA-binding protein SmpB [Brevibacterium luteolum]